MKSAPDPHSCDRSTSSHITKYLILLEAPLPTQELLLTSAPAMHSTLLLL